MRSSAGWPFLTLAAEGPRGQERALQEASRETDVRQRDPEGCRLKKTVTSDARRKSVTHACDTHGVSQRRACKALNVDRTAEAEERYYALMDLPARAA